MPDEVKDQIRLEEQYQQWLMKKQRNNDEHHATIKSKDSMFANIPSWRVLHEVHLLHLVICILGHHKKDALEFQILRSPPLFHHPTIEPSVTLNPG